MNETLAVDEDMDFEQKQGDEQTLLQTRHTCAQGFWGTPDILLSFLLSHLNQRFHLGRVLSQAHGDSLGDTWRWVRRMMSMMDE